MSVRAMMAILLIALAEAGAGGEAVLPALVKVRYLAGKGEEFIVRDAAPIKAILAWLEKAESGSMSEHERIGLCERDAEMGFYAAPEDVMPKRTVFLYIACGHVSGRVVKAEQFADLRRILVPAKSSPPPPSGGKP